VKYELHVTDIRTFKQCRRKWDFSSPLRRNLEPVVPYAPFFTGRAIHYALERYYRDRQDFNDSIDEWLANERKQLGVLWPAEQARLEEQLELIDAMLNHYALHISKATGRWDDANLEFIDMEIEFSVPLYTPRGARSNRVFLAGRFDGFVRNRIDGTYWVFETKTTRSIEELVRGLQLDEQCGAYIFAAQQVFQVPVAGVLYNVMRKKAPAIPPVLQNGMLSQAKNMDTTPEIYLKAIRDQHPGINRDDIMATYGPMLQFLLDQPPKYFARVPVYRSPAEIAELAANLWTVGLEMVRPSTPLYPSPSWFTCNFCQFKAPCIALSSGADPEFILAAEYQQRVAARSFREYLDATNEL
jgi:hypothetical protein